MFKKTLLLVAGLALVALAPVSAQENASVSIIHGIPGSDGLPVDVEVDGTCLLPNFTFGEVAGPLSLPPDTYTVSIKLADSMMPCSGATAIGPADIEFLAGESASVIAHLTDMGELTASKFTNDISDPLPGQGRLIARHTAAAGAVDILAERGRQSSIRVSNVQNTQGVGFDLRFRKWDLTLADPATGTPVLGPAEIILQPFTVTVVYAVGDPGAGTFTAVAETIDLR